MLIVASNDPYRSAPITGSLARISTAAATSATGRIRVPTFRAADDISQITGASTTTGATACRAQ
jgi:hypothetical protein